MFNENTCNRCGACLLSCKFIEVTKTEAKTIIASLIQCGESGEVATKCVHCFNCDVVCPTDSNPSDLMIGAIRKRNAKYGASVLWLMDESNPYNVFSIRNSLDTEAKNNEMQRYQNPPKSEVMFYTGCVLPEQYDNLPETEIFKEMPMVGGVKYCCGIEFFNNFEKEAVEAKGKKLFDSFKSLGIKKLVTICPACHLMVGKVYPNVIGEWDIVSQDLNEYLVEKISENKLIVKNPIRKKITFHDPCAWKKQDPKIYDSPRKLLELMGATVVEMTPSRQKSSCCGLHARDKSLSNELAHNKLTTARTLEADYLAVSCLACFQLSKKSAQYQINTIHMIDLALETIAGQYARRKESEIEKLDIKFNEKLAENPDIINRRVVFKNGELKALSN